MPDPGKVEPRSSEHEPEIHRLRAEIVEVGRLLFAGGLIAGTDGNISARCGPDRILITASGLRKGGLETQHCIVVDLDGQLLDGAAQDGLLDPEAPEVPDRATLSTLLRFRPSSEIAMHLEAYRQRPEIGAIVHAHPPHVIALSIAGIELDAALLPEALLFLGFPPTIPYARPSSTEGALAIREAVAGHDALVLARHGSLALAASPMDALGKTETLEQLARVTCILAGLGASPTTAGQGFVPTLAGLAMPHDRAAELMRLRAELGLGRPADQEDLDSRYGTRST